MLDVIIVIIQLIAILIKPFIWLAILIGIVVAIHETLKPQKKPKNGENQYKDWMEGHYKVERRNQKQATGEKTGIKRPANWKVEDHPKKYRQYSQTNAAEDQKPENQSKTTAKPFGKGETTRFKRPENWEEALRPRQSEVKPQEPEKIVWNKEFLLSIEWKLFEDICVEYLKSRKCKANVTNIGKDDGIDLKVTNSEGKLMFIGQCKAWSQPVNVKEIRELYGIMAAENASDGFYITTSTFTSVAKDFAKGKRILLIDGDQCIRRFNQLDEASKAEIEKLVKVNGFNIPTCVNCNTKMVKRVSQKPHNKGNEFWGCRNYPQCKNTLKIRGTAANQPYINRNKWTGNEQEKMSTF